MGDFGIPGARQRWTPREVQLLVEAVVAVPQVPDQGANAVSVHQYLQEHYPQWTRNVHGIKHKIQTAHVMALAMQTAQAAGAAAQATDAAVEAANVAAAIQELELTALRVHLDETEQQLAEAGGQNHELQQQSNALRAEMDQMETFYAQWQDDVVAHVQGVLYDGAVALAERARQLPALLPRARRALPSPPLTLPAP